MRWIWDENKNRTNRRKHGLGFETASLVFEDPLMAHRPDPNPDEERWHTIGKIGSVVVLVAHTWPEPQGGRDGSHHQRPQSHGARKESL